MATASLTIGIGGSGGVFAPSLFTGAMAGTAFGVIAHHAFGPAVGAPAIYGVVAMGAVFAAAAQAPLTAIASVVEMTGNFGLTLPIMLAVGVAAGVSKRLTYGTIYTTKLLRRGTDIERPRPASLLQVLTVADTMQPVPHPLGTPRDRRPSGHPAQDGPVGPLNADHQWTRPLGRLVDLRVPQVLQGQETLEQALRQLVLYGPDGLPVLSPDRRQVIGWITSNDVIDALAARLAAYPRDAAQANTAAEWAKDEPSASLKNPPDPLPGHEIAEIAITDSSRWRDQPVGEAEWPAGATPLAVTRRHRTRPAHPDTALRVGDHVIVLVPRPTPPSGQRQGCDVPTSDAARPG